MGRLVISTRQDVVVWDNTYLPTCYMAWDRAQAPQKGVIYGSWSYTGVQCSATQFSAVQHLPTDSQFRQ